MPNFIPPRKGLHLRERLSNIPDNYRKVATNIGLLIAFQAIDIIATSVGISKGIQENNGLVKHLIENYGPLGFVGLKTALTIGGLGLLYGRSMNEKTRLQALRMGNTILATIALIDTLAIKLS